MSTIKEKEVITINRDALMDSDFNLLDLRVYLLTKLESEKANANGGEFAPENISFATEIGIHPRTLQKSFERLEKRGYILREMKDGKRYVYL